MLIQTSQLLKALSQDGSKAGINVDIFGAHSVRAASTSAAKVKGLPLDMIMSAAGWSNESTFEKFYCKAIDSIREKFEQVLLMN